MNHLPSPSPPTGTIQLLFPQLERVLGPLTEKQQQLVRPWRSSVSSR